MIKSSHLLRGIPAMAVGLLLLPAGPASAQMMKVQCPASTTLHQAAPAAIVAGTNSVTGDTVPGGAIKCQEIAGGDGYATMADGSQTYLFGFGPLSGLDLVAAGKPGTQTAADFMKPYNAKYLPERLINNLPAATAANPDSLQPNPFYDSTQLDENRNGALLQPVGMTTVGVLSAQQPAPLIAIDEDDELFLTLSNVGMIMRPDLFEQHTVHFHGYPNASSYYDGVPDASVAVNISGSMTYYYTAPDAGTYFWHCHITPPEHLQMGMVGQLYVRPRQNQVAVGTDVRAALVAQNKAIAVKKDPNAKDPNVLAGLTCNDILCTGQTPAPASTGTAPTVAREAATVKYAYNDGDGSTAYDVEYPIQMMGFDPTFHWVGMTFNPEDFSGMKDRYFMLSGRGYPDTVGGGALTTPTSTNPAGIGTGALTTQASDGLARPSQVIPSLIQLTSCSSSGGGTPCAGTQHRALLRISDLSVTEFSTLATIGIPMKVIAVNARLLRDQAGYSLAYKTNSITMGGGESTDVILDSTDVPKGTYFLYSTNLDHLSNDAENFGGMMTEIVVN
jgi:FtsP/CotA-like multicopper oxidase with cupredoxin domain